MTVHCRLAEIEAGAFRQRVETHPLRSGGVAAALPIDLLVIDVFVPCLGGMEVIRRPLALRARLKVLLISIGRLSEKDVADAAPGARFPPKPFSSHELTRTMREMLDARPYA